MRSGVLDRRITFQRPVLVEDPEYGGQQTTWETVFARLPAQVQDDLPSQSEQVQNGLKMADRPARVRVRYLRGVTSDMRVVLHDEVDTLFYISGGPAEIGRREWTEFTMRAYSS